MMRSALLVALLLAAACSRKTAQNYRQCLKLRIGMTREQVVAAMGPPEETFPYVEGKSLPHLAGRTAYEWGNPASMPAPNRVSFDDASGKAESIRCGGSVITTAVFIEPPEPVLSTAAAPGAPPPAPVAPRRAPGEAGSSSARSSGRPLTE
jgi:hypothetical protein